MNIRYLSYEKLRAVLFSVSTLLLASCGGGSSEPAIDTTPASFSFTEQSEVALNTDSVSSVITISGIEADTNISIVGGEYSINGGAYTSATAMISNGQQVQVRHTSSANYGTETTTTLTIGGVSGSYTTLTIPQLSFVTGCSELYGEDCTNVDDWTATLWQDDLSEALAERSFSENDTLYFPEANDKETVNYSASGTVSVVDNTRTIHAHTFLGVNADQTYTFSTTELGFPKPETALLNSNCETFTLDVNGIPAGEEQSLAVQMYNPNNPHLPLSFERITPSDTDDSQDYTVTSCNNSVLVILSANKTAYAEFDTASVDEGDNGSVTLLTPSTSSPYSVRTHLGRAAKKGIPIPLGFSTSNQYIFSPEAASLVTYDYQAQTSCTFISDVGDACFNSAQRFNDTTVDTTANLTFPDFSITQFDLTMDERQLDVNWVGTETPTNFRLFIHYSGMVNEESITLIHYVYFSATTLSTAIPPLPSPYQSWLDNGNLDYSIHLLILDKKEIYSDLSFSDMISSEHTVNGVQSLLNSPEAYNYPMQVVLKLK